MTLRIIILFLILVGINLTGTSQTQIKSIEHDGITREYRLHIPLIYHDSIKTPLIFNLHGFTSNGFEQELYSEFSNISDTANVIVVYPEGTNNAWNSGIIVGGVDDVGFISSLIDTLAGRYNIDLTRVYAMGMSNGGFMSHFLACELGDRIAAISSVTGSMFISLPARCEPSRPISILQFHGTNDEVVPYEGDFAFLSVDSMMRFWAGINDCNMIPDTFELPDLTIADSSTATLLTYDSCSNTTETILYRINNGGHTWPGAFSLPNQITNQDIKASNLIWEFFKRHQHPDPRPAMTTALEEDLYQELNIFPNPFSEQIFIKNIFPEIEKLEVWDLSGKKLVENNKIAKADINLITADWPSGMYFIRVKIKGKWFDRKLVKRF